MGGPVERFDPRKMNALSFKRQKVRNGRRGKSVCINEITLEEVRNDAVDFGLATDVLYQMNEGKEASIFLALWKTHPIVLKAYRFWCSSQSSKSRGFYAPVKMSSLAAKEFDVLMSCFRTGAAVPTPIGRVGNYLTMRFIGDEDTPAPQLKDVHLEEPGRVLDQLLDDYLLIYSQANYVHGDLSKYNILWWDGRAWIIDLPQAYNVGAWADMNRVVSLLTRDIDNLLSYFEDYGIYRDVTHIQEVFLSEYVPDNLRTFDVF